MTLDSQAAFFNSYIASGRISGRFAELPAGTVAAYRMDPITGQPDAYKQNDQPATQAQPLTLTGGVTLIGKRLQTDGVNGIITTGWLTGTDASKPFDVFFMLQDAGPGIGNASIADFSIAAENDADCYAKITISADAPGQRTLNLVAFDKGATGGVKTSFPPNLGMFGLHFFRLRVNPASRILTLLHVGSGTTITATLPSYAWAQRLCMAVGGAYRGLSGPPTARTIYGAEKFAAVGTVGAALVMRHTLDGEIADTATVLAGLTLTPAIFSTKTGGSATVFKASVADPNALPTFSLTAPGTLKVSGLEATYTPPSTGSGSGVLRATLADGSVDESKITVGNLVITPSVPPAGASLASVSIDPSFDASKITGEEGDWLRVINRLVGSYSAITPTINYRTRKLTGDATNGVAGTISFDVGRATSMYIQALTFLGRSRGAPYALNESERLSDILYNNMPTVTITPDYGNNVTLQMMAPKPGNVQLNRKENSLPEAAETVFTYNMWKNLDVRPGNTGRVERSFARNKLLKKLWQSMRVEGDNSIPRSYQVSAIDRVVHPAADYSLRCAMWAEMAETSAEQREYAQLRDWMAELLSGAIFWTDVDGIGECTTYAYDVAAISGVGSRNSSSYQPACYIGHNSTIFLSLAMMGVDFFRTDRFLKAHANMLHMMQIDGPMKAVSRDGTGTFDTYRFCTPPNLRWNNTVSDPEPTPKRFYNDFGKSQLLKQYDAFSHYRSADQMEVFGAGATMMHASDNYFNYQKTHAMGTPSNPKSSGDAIGYAIGAALRHSGKSVATATQI